MEEINIGKGRMAKKLRTVIQIAQSLIQKEVISERLGGYLIGYATIDVVAEEIEQEIGKESPEYLDAIYKNSEKSLIQLHSDYNPNSNMYKSLHEPLIEHAMDRLKDSINILNGETR